MYERDLLNDNNKVERSVVSAIVSHVLRKQKSSIMIISANFVYVSRNDHTRRFMFNINRRLRNDKKHVIKDFKQFNRVMLARIKVELFLKKS